ncbi:COG3650 family protein [Brevundimonas sp.]|uniref:COG3650 family protein n=1 Tax=Brevundimonas sp. TaxID=1871086 RepID=UPI003569B53D
MRLPVLAACSQPADSPVEAPIAPMASAVLAGVDLTKPVRVGGNEPFWSIELTGMEMVYSGVDRPEQRAPQPAANVQGTVAAFAGTTTAGNPLKVTLTATECSDGMSDREYPLSALVEIGEETLTGCAASASAFAAASESGRVVDTVQPAA